MSNNSTISATAPEELPDDGSLPEGWSDRIHRGRRGDTCVYCALVPEPGQATMDHVFPANLYPGRKSNNLLTVPACKPCNQRKALGDQPLRDYVTFSMDADISSDLIEQLKKIVRATMRNQSVLGASFNRANEIRKSVDPFDLGGPLPISLDGAGELIMETVAMTVRGLYFANHGQVLPADYPTQSKVYTRAEGEDMLGLLARSPRLWIGSQGNGRTNWAVFTSPRDSLSVLAVMAFNGGVFFGAASGMFVKHRGEYTYSNES